jgi:hypothetical protein
VAAAVFLPVLPVQLLGQNICYDITQLALPVDRVDPEQLARPHRWSTRDLLTFVVAYLAVLQAAKSAYRRLTGHWLWPQPDWTGPRTHDHRNKEHDRGVRSALIGGLATAVGLAAGCGSSAAPQRAPTPVPSTVAAPSATPSTHRLGEKVRASNGFVEVTVYAYQQPAATGAPVPDQPGLVWGAADVQACSSPTSIFDVSVSDAPWALVFADGSLISPATAGHAEFPQPVYPSTPRGLKPGECLRGWITFAVPPATAPEFVRYAPQDAAALNWVAR